MGKDRSAQRTKGNKKPSSSAQSAELLGGASSFVGFSALQGLGYVPAASQQGSQADELTVCAEFRVVLRKMTKKDSTTKIKALQEFQALCKDKDVDSALSALPFWPRLYAKLSTDVDRRVREATQEANRAVVGRVGRQLAPHLRALVPSWALAMVDPHPPASSSATRAFQDAFTPDKRGEVMVFTCQEVTDTISDNLFIQKPETLSDPKQTDPEDMKNKYVHVVSCSLHALSLLVTTVSATDTGAPKLAQSLTPLLDNQIFWKLSKNQYALVRGAWFSCLNTLYEHQPQLLEGHEGEITSAVLPALDDQEGAVLPAIWAAFIHLCLDKPEVMSGSKTCGTVFKRVTSVIREGCRGSAGELCPQLLPILSMVPLHTLDKPSDFCTNFLRALTTGLVRPGVVCSGREAAAMVGALRECVTFLTTRVKDTGFWDTAVHYQMVELLKASFTSTPMLSTTNLYRETSEFLRVVHKKVVSGGAQAIEEHIWNVFWTKLVGECELLVQTGEEGPISRMVMFFTVLHKPKSKSVLRREGVKFVDESTGQGPSVSPPGQCDDKEKLFLEDTGVKLISLACTCLRLCQDSQNAAAHHALTVLLASFPALSLLTALLPSPAPEEGCVRLVVEEVLLPLVEGAEESSQAPHHTVHAFLSLYDLMDAADKEHVLHNLKPSLPVSVLRQMMERLAERCGLDEVGASWLRSAQLGGRLVDLVDQLCEVPQSALQVELVALFTFVLSQGNKEEPIIAMEQVSRILGRLGTRLQSNMGQEGAKEEQVVQLVAGLAAHLFSSRLCWQTRGIREFMDSLFIMVCQFSEVLSADTVAHLEDTFLQGFRGLLATVPQSEVGQLLEKDSCLRSTLMEIKARVLSPGCSFHLARTLAQLTMRLLELVFELLPEEDCHILTDHALVQAMVDLVTPTEGEWVVLEAGLSPLYVTPYLLNGLAFRELRTPKNITAHQQEDHSHSRMSLFLSLLLLSLCGSPPSHKEEEEKEEMEKKEEGEVVGGQEGGVSLGRYTHLVVSALHSTCHATLMQELNTMVKRERSDADLQLGTQLLREHMVVLLRLLNQGNKRLITKKIRDRCSDGSSMWCVTLTLVLSEWMQHQDVNVQRLLDELDEDALGVTATKQALLPLLPQEAVLALLSQEVTRLSSDLAHDPLLAPPSLALVTTALSLVPSSASGPLLPPLLATLVQWREQADSLFLFASDVGGLAWEELMLPCWLVRLVSVLVKGHAVHLQPPHWDFILCSLSSWVQTLSESRESLHCKAVVGILACAVSKCVGCVSHFMAGLQKSGVDKENIQAGLVDDWREFFSTTIYSLLIPLFVKLAGVYSEEPSILLYGVCRGVSIGVYHAGEDHLASHSLPPAPTSKTSKTHDGPHSLPTHHKVLLGHLVPLLLSSHPAVQVTSCTLLSTALPALMEAWEQNSVEEDEDNDDGPQRPLPYPITSFITAMSAKVETLMCGRKIGETWEVEAHSPQHSTVLAYLLAWHVALAALTRASDALQHQYCAFLRQTSLVPTLLSHLFLLMPQQPGLQEGEGDTASPTTMFSTQPNLSPMTPDSLYVSHLACQVYLSCLRHMPAAVRQWFSFLDRPSQGVVEAFTATHVSPLLIQQEMSAISSSSTKFPNMTVRVRPGAREVVATYTIDEASMELILRLAPNHPLSTVTVDDHRRVGVSLQQWRNWLLGLNTMLSHRNTPLLQSLEFWKQNVDQKFKGIEECYICYYVLHGTSHQLPKLLCRTCKKKFHSACLYKWFNSSNNSTCPLCRSLF